MQRALDTRPSGRSVALRRYPALGFFGLAALIAVALPSALTVPNAGPPTLAEFAPVPGHGAAGGALGRLGSGSSGGPGGGTGPSQPGGAFDPGQPTSNLKRCVGSPPRQTEDPLSPPCVAFFEGDNGDKTWRGVTRDEIRVVIHQPPFAGTSQPSGTLVDYALPPSEQDRDQDFWIRTLARYFNDRYQTYGRFVHFYGLYSTTGNEADMLQKRRAEAARVDTEVKPFATVALSFTGIVPYLDESTSRGMVGVTSAGFGRGFHRRASPLLWSVYPDLEDEAALAAGYACRRLKGRPARFSGMPTETGKTRVFGLVYSRSEREPENKELADLMTARLADCGIEVAATVGASERIEQAQGEAPDGIAALRLKGVTTVILAARAQTTLAFTGAATSAGWFPEWYIPGRRSITGVDQAANARLLPQEQWRHAFGISFSSRWGDPKDMHWARAYQETCGGCDIRGPYYFGAYAYDTMQMLFHGIQAAGPRLTPANFDKGMHAIPQRPSLNPFTPAAYFAPGNYTYIKDAMEIWWDTAGQAPGSEGATGCYRVPRGGRRFRANEWPPGDGGLFEDGPCNGDAPLA